MEKGVHLTEELFQGPVALWPNGFVTAKSQESDPERGVAAMPFLDGEC